MASSVKQIKAVQGQQLTAEGATYLDVRTPEEYRAGHAPGALNIPVALNVAGEREENAQFVEQVKAAVPDPATPLCVACMGGSRSAGAAAQLAAAGYSNVKHMEDGFRGWRDSGLPVEKGAGKPSGVRSKA